MSTLEKKSGMTYAPGDVPLFSIIVFPQTRKTFEQEDIIDLADDFSIHGLLHPPIVGKLSKTNFIVYKETFEAIYNIKLPHVDSYPTYQGYYHCLIAGERRYRGHVLLWNQGCTSCREKAGDKTLSLGQCYHHHFGDDLIEVRTCLEIDPLDAKSIQFRENNHKQPPVHEMADDYLAYYLYLKKFQKKKITLAQFAKIVGASVEKVRRTLWFCELPEIVQEAVRLGKISHSHGLIFKKIMDSKINSKAKKLSFVKEELEFLLARPRMNVKVDDFKKRIEARLEVLIHGYGALFEEQSIETTRKNIRRIVGKDMIPVITAISQYLKDLSDKDRRRILGKGKLFSGKSPNHQVATIAKILKALYPGIVFTPKQLERIATSRNFEIPAEETVIMKAV